jgi:hypothetical protein
MITLKYFKRKEFACPCCGKSKMKTEFLIALDKARMCSNTSYKLNSGWRCQKHNDSLKHSKPNSSHIDGIAVDIACNGSRERALIIGGLLEAGFSRIGIGKTFIHADLADRLGGENTKDEAVFWLY